MAALGCRAWLEDESTLLKGDQLVWDEPPVGAPASEVPMPKGSVAGGAVRGAAAGEGAARGVGSSREGVLDVVLVAGEICTMANDF